METSYQCGCRVHNIIVHGGVTDNCLPSCFFFVRVIDSDYRGNVRVILFNHGVVPVKIAIGDRIAQLILERIAILPIVVVTTLDETQRGEGGFGSTGTGVVLPLSEADKKDLLQTKRQKVE